MSKGVLAGIAILAGSVGVLSMMAAFAFLSRQVFMGQVLAVTALSIAGATGLIALCSEGRRNDHAAR